MNKAIKVLRKIARGEFAELVFRLREENIRRRERRHHAEGMRLFEPSALNDVFTPEFLSQFSTGDAGPDLAAALRSKDPQLFFPGLAKLERFGEAVAAMPGEQRQRILTDADCILGDKYPVFHRAPQSYGSPPSWNFDPDARRLTPESFYGDIDFLNRDLVGDSKVIWELSRFQFVYDLGQAYALTGDERYPAKFFKLLHDWNERNPDYQGINFCSALEFAFRAHSLTWALFFFRNSRALDVNAAADIYRLLNICGRFMRDHLSVYFSPNTHLLGEAYGLYMLGTMYPEFGAATEWRACGRRILLEELDRQFTAEGMHAERSVCYHAYALEFYLSFAILAAKNGDPLPPHVGARLEQMTNVLAWLRRPDGRWPDLGDNDGGRLYFASRVAQLDYEPILETSMRCLGWTTTNQVRFAESFWLAPDASPDRANDLAAETESALLQDSGLIISRTGETFSVFQFGAFGYADCPHSHADHLHLEIAVGEDALLVDPGTYCYSGNPAGRNQFRSCLAHNGPRILGSEYLVPDDLFAWRQKPYCRLDGYVRGGEAEFYEAAYTVAIDPSHQARLRRTVLFIGDGSWLVRDTIRCSKPIQAAWDFRSHKSIGWKDKAVLISGTQTLLTITPVSLLGHEVESMKSWIPADYGRGSWGTALRIVTHLNEEIDFGFVMQTAPITLKKNAGLDPAALYERTETPLPAGAVEAFQFFGHAPLTGGRIDSDAEIGYVALGPLDRRYVALVKASRLMVDNVPVFASDRPVAFVELSFDGAVWTVGADSGDGITVPDPSICRFVAARRGA